MKWNMGKKAKKNCFRDLAESLLPETGNNAGDSDAFVACQEMKWNMGKKGIVTLESMVFDALVKDEAYEFLFVFTPIRFKGATGSPGRPIAIR